MSAGQKHEPSFDAEHSGLYRAPDARVLAAATAAGVDAVSISLAGATDKGALLECFAAALVFPEWFGANWDALEDCLEDLSWRADATRLLMIEGFEPLAARARDDFGVLLDLLRDVAEYWSGRGRGFFVLFVDPGHKLRLRGWGETVA